VNLLDAVIFLLEWEMRAVKFILHNDDKEGRDYDDDDDDDIDEKKKFPLILLCEQ